MENGNRDKKEDDRELIIKSESEKEREEKEEIHRRENENSSKFNLEQQDNNYL